jgi:putative DNA primase/helicase
MHAPQNNAGADTVAALDFIHQWFGATEQPVYICSIANDRSDTSEPSERHVATRDDADARPFITKWDRPSRGLFFCVSTIRDREKRNKENVVEIPGLWADVDFKDVDDDEATILRRVKALPKPPSIIVRSGNGLHLYWKFKEALTVNIVDGAETIERVEAALKLLADLVGGDMLVTQPANLMRLPGSHNSKRDSWKLAEIESSTGHEYHFDDLEEMLFETAPVVLRKLRPAQIAGETNPFLEAAKTLGYKPPIDVEKRLSLMIYMGGEDGIHGTQLVVTASMLNAGVPIDEVVSLVLERTRAAAGDYGARWNWAREEKAIRGMCATWLKKHPPGEDDDKVEYADADDIDDGDDDVGVSDTTTGNDDERVANEAPVAKKLQIIKIKPRISVVTSNTEQMLVNAKVPFYQRSGELVRPIITTVKAAHGHQTKTAQLKPVSSTYMRDTMCRHSIWQKFDGRKNKWVGATPPMNVAETLLARDGKWAFPEIVGVIATPTMRPDGTLLIKQGYDPVTRLLLIEPPPMPAIPDEPTRDDAMKALALVEALVKESPFVDDIAKAVGLAGIITAVVRGAFPVSPMFASTAPVAGTGKSFLWDIAAAISAGQRRMPVIAAGDEAEIEKRMVGVLLSGQPLVSIDNVNGELKSDFLAQVIEQHILDIRPLGRSPLTRIETGALTTYCTGNNIVIVGDLCRRTITARLNAKKENPQYIQYTGDPISTILENRGTYIAACLTICRAYVVAGRPGLLPRLASFEGWSDIVRSALVWLGQADCIASMELTRAEDPQRAALSDVLTAWGSAITIGKGGRVTLAVIVELASEVTSTGNDYGATPELVRPELNAALRAAVALGGAGNGSGSHFTPKLDSVTLGRWCKANKERIVDGVYLMNQPSAKGVATWWIERGM